MVDIRARNFGDAFNDAFMSRRRDESITEAQNQFRKYEITPQQYYDVMLRNDIPTMPRDNELTPQRQRVIDDLYSIEHGYPSVKYISNMTGIRPTMVKQVLQPNPMKAKFAQQPRPNHFRKTIARHPNDVWQCDLIDFVSLVDAIYVGETITDRAKRMAFRYGLIVIDCFSRYVWLIPLRYKDADTVTEVFLHLVQLQIYESPIAVIGRPKPKLIPIDYNSYTHRVRSAAGKPKSTGAKFVFRAETKPNILFTDYGSEFQNDWFQHLLRMMGIRHWNPRRGDDGKIIHDAEKGVKFDGHAQMVERAIRTIKSIMYKHVASNPTIVADMKQFRQLIETVTDYYNAKIHSALGISPTNAYENGLRSQIHHHAKYYKPRVVPEPKFNVGDVVRVRLQNTTFQKGYKPKFSAERYKIIARQLGIDAKRNPFHYYKVQYGNDVMTVYESDLI